MTKEERYLIKAYDLAKELGDPEEEVDRYYVGKKLGFHDKAVDNIVKTLKRPNFIRQGEDSNIYLTAQGLALVESMR